MRVKLYTYSKKKDSDGYSKIFKISRRFVKKLIKEFGYKNLKEFLADYTYDTSEKIYYIAKEHGIKMKEYEVEG